MQPTSPSSRLCHGIVLYPASQSFSAPPPPTVMPTHRLAWYAHTACPAHPPPTSIQRAWLVHQPPIVDAPTEKTSASIRPSTPSVVTLFQSPKNYAGKIPSGVNMAGLRWGSSQSGIHPASRLAASVRKLSLSWAVCWLILSHGHCSVFDSHHSFIFLPSLSRSHTHTQTGLSDSSQ